MDYEQRILKEVSGKTVEKAVLDRGQTAWDDYKLSITFTDGSKLIVEGLGVHAGEGKLMVSEGRAYA